MALGDGPVRRVLSLRGGRYFGKLLSGVGLSYESVTPDVTQAGWVHSLVHTTGAPSSSRRGCRAGAGAGPGARLGCGLRGMRMAHGQVPLGQKSAPMRTAPGPRPVVNHARLGTRQRHVDVNRICNGERSTFKEYVLVSSQQRTMR